MDTDDVLHAISTLPDPSHPSTQIARRAATEIERLRAALEPFAVASEVAVRALGQMADAGHIEAVAKNYIGLHDMKEAARALGRLKP